MASHRETEYLAFVSWKVTTGPEKGCEHGELLDKKEPELFDRRKNLQKQLFKAELVNKSQPFPRCVRPLSLVDYSSEEFSLLARRIL
ncbi:unnamed protein product [Dovyalis caffra]|uniref:Uncharacterized protein n=1 Tax=Dovyalis caffra TaxID=77055 RepID=A0AAV1SCV3_9ROSI|nr:unnamed protein product [Dovyalis caffra]